MGALVDELLMLARIDAGLPLARAEVDLTHLILDVAEESRLTFGDHRWLLDLPEDPIAVTGDPDGLRQVLRNLFSNAARHTPVGSAVEARLVSRPNWSSSR